MIMLKNLNNKGKSHTLFYILILGINNKKKNKKKRLPSSYLTITYWKIAIENINNKKKIIHEIKMNEKRQEDQNPF